MTAILVSFDALHPPLFPLGELLATPSVVEEVTQAEIANALGRHAKGDWGEADEEQSRANKHALETGGKILSEFTSNSGTKFWILTEPSHYATTVLLPEEE